MKILGSWDCPLNIWEFPLNIWECPLNIWECPMNIWEYPLNIWQCPLNIWECPLNIWGSPMKSLGLQWYDMVSIGFQGISGVSEFLFLKQEKYHDYHYSILWILKLSNENSESFIFLPNFVSCSLVVDTVL